MKEIKIKKTEKDDKLIVNVKLPARRYARDPVYEFSNSELIQYLKEQGVTLSDYQAESQSSEYLTSYSTKGLEPKLQGTWVFNKINKVEEKMNKPKSQTYKKRKSKKSGD
tara:strand:- start:743 stop:1072 length:330 start_codon:yes stop_codon:yes gene_type:complete